jgi:predicted RNA binding protein YcfA (HicA-like mRNA interferase family)
MPKKIRELKAILLKAGFTWRPGKGSHTQWQHEQLPEDPITIAGKDGSDARLYLERQVARTLKKLADLKEDEES